MFSVCLWTYLCSTAIHEHEMDTASDHHPEGVDENGNKANVKGGPRELYLVTA